MESFPLQIKVEARLVGVNRDALEQLGVEFPMFAEILTDTGRNAGSTTCTDGDRVVDTAVIGGVPGVHHLVPMGHRTDSFLGAIVTDGTFPFGDVHVYPMLPFFGGVDFAPGAYELPSGLPEGLNVQNLPPQDAGLGGSRVAYDIYDDDLEAGALYDLLVSDGRNRGLIAPTTCGFSGQRFAYLVEDVIANLDELTPEMRRELEKLNPPPQVAIAGVILEVTAKSLGNDIGIDLRLGSLGVTVPHPTQFDVDGNPSNVLIPLLQRSRNSTLLTIPDGKTAVIGGLLARGTSEPEPGLPILSKIPLLGDLFSSRKNFSEDQNLVIFITPRIVRD
ncbi:MAG: hypothetical protein ACT4PV_11200 [Planctomycetaceae bacterium]